MPEHRNTFVSLALANVMSSLGVPEAFVDVISSSITRSSDIKERLILMGGPYKAHTLDEDFSVEVHAERETFVVKNVPLVKTVLRIKVFAILTRQLFAFSLSCKTKSGDLEIVQYHGALYIVCPVLKPGRAADQYGYDAQFR